MSDNMNEYTPELYELVDEDGNKKNFEMIDAMEFEGENYFALVPAFEGEDEAEALLNDDGELVILKAEEVDGEEMLTSITDDDEFDKVSQVFMKRIMEMLENDDCCCECDDDCCCGHDHK